MRFQLIAYCVGPGCKCEATSGKVIYESKSLEAVKDYMKNEMNYNGDAYVRDIIFIVTDDSN